jgi:hypothetical protein
MRELIGFPEGFALAALLVLGHPQGQVTRLSRRRVEEFTYLDRFGGTPFTDRGGLPT